jgi:hypothetical protein
MATVGKQEIERQDTGTAVMFMGLSVWVADLLVLFFLPSGYRVGRESTFLAIMMVLGVLGLLLILGGYRKRGKAAEE